MSADATPDVDCTDAHWRAADLSCRLAREDHRMARTGTAARKIKIMISSQCNRKFPAGGRTLTDIRRDVRDRLEAAKLLGQQLFEVWINEDAPAAGLEKNAWETCMSQVRRADVLLVLDAGHAGWALTGGDVGICHAELMTAFNSAPAKIRIIPIRGTDPLADEDSTRNKRFQDYVASLSAFMPAVETEADLNAAIDKAVIDAVTQLTAAGVGQARRGRFYSGDALDWAKLDSDERQKRMVAALRSALSESGGEIVDDAVIYELSGTPVGFHLHASPSALSWAPSRELVGRPFLQDHVLIESYKRGVAGPVHVVAAPSGATESQARSLLGIPLPTLVAPPFGVFAADETQQVQLVLLNGCRDETTTRNAMHRFLDWLREEGQKEALVGRAGSRRQIAGAIRKEVSRIRGK